MRAKFVLLLPVFLTAALVLRAQPKWDMGFQGGPLFSTMFGFSNTSLMKLSGQGGFVFTRRDAHKNHLQLEVNVVRKGAWRKPEADNPDKINLSLYYVETPLMYRYDNLKLSRKGRGGFHIGLSYARLVSPQLRRNGVSQDFNPIWSDKYDLSMLGGIHVVYYNHLKVGTRVTYSINPILRRNILPGEIENFNSQATHNLTVQFSVAWMIRGLYY